MTSGLYAILVTAILAVPATAQDTVAARSTSFEGFSGAKLTFGLGSTLSKQDVPEAGDPDDVAKELSNPNSVLSQLTFKQVYTTFRGDLPDADDQTSNTTIFQPVFPFPLGEGTNLFVRPGFAYVYDQPVFDGSSGNWDTVSGWADVGFDVAIGHSFPSGWLVVGGIQGTIPSYSDLSGEQWRLGPEILVGHAGEKWSAFVFPQHQWDVAGDDSYNYSTSVVELIVQRHLEGGWTLISDNKFSYDHVAEQWTAPVNLAVSKVAHIGKTPVKFQLGVDYYVQQDKDELFSPDTAITFQITPVVPNFIYDWIKG